MVRARVEEKCHYSEVLRNLSDGFNFPQGRLDFLNRGVTYLNRLHQLSAISRWRTWVSGVGRAFKACLSVWR